MSDDVVKSPEKVHALIDELPVMLARQDDPKLQGLVGFWPMVRPTVEAMLPDDPGQLDVVLETLAIWALRARSDDARGFMMRVDGGDVQARFLDQLDAAAAAETNGGATVTVEKTFTEPPDYRRDAPAIDDVPTEPMGPPLVPEDDEEA